MRRLILTVTAAVLFTGMAQAQPHLAAPAAKFDFGIIPANAALTHRFWLHSTGTDTVRISEIKTGCSCVVSDQEAQQIAPGDSLLLGFSWNTNRMRGTIYRSPRIFYEGVADPLILQMSAVTYDYPDSARPVSIRPYRFEFGRTTNADIDSIAFTLTNHSDEDLKIQLISPPNEEVGLTVPETVAANGKATGYARLNRSFRDKEFEISVTLLVGDSRATHVTVPIRRKFY